MNRNYNIILSTDDLLRKSSKRVNCNPLSQGRSKPHNWFISFRDWLIWSALGYSKMGLKLKIWTAVEHLSFFLIKSKCFISIVLKFLWQDTQYFSWHNSIWFDILLKNLLHLWLDEGVTKWRTWSGPQRSERGRFWRGSRCHFQLIWVVLTGQVLHASDCRGRRTFINTPYSLTTPQRLRFQSWLNRATTQIRRHYTGADFQSTEITPPLQRNESSGNKWRMAFYAFNNAFSSKNKKCEIVKQSMTCFVTVIIVCFLLGRSHRCDQNI